ncbi:MAG: YeeE/YedE thiosulfate transporter family protein [Candidatus Kapaibacteriota bacterium]
MVENNHMKSEESTKAFHKEKFPEKSYWNPYIAGVGLGLVLLSAFVLMGRGLGASGAVSTIVATSVAKITPSHAQDNEFYQNYLTNENPLKDWLVFEVLGVLVGGFISGIFANRVKFKIVKGQRISNSTRMIFAVLGGIMMGFGAKLAGGCTSGQALTGGALLNLGSWAFMLSVFAGGYLVAYFFRRFWL